MTTPQELLDRTGPLLGNLGAAFYFHPDTLARGKELGLDGFRFYFLGRGGVLGDVEPAVIASAFGYFNIDLVASMWNSAKAIVPPREAARAYFDCCGELGRKKLAGVEGLDGFCAAAEAIVRTAHPAGLALFAGIAAEPLADDVPARALQLAAVLRELRGSVHLVAVVASGLDPAVAHAIRRPDMVGAFGYQGDIVITDADRERLESADRLTDQLLAPLYAGLDDDARAAFLAGVEAMAAAMA